MDTKEPELDKYSNTLSEIIGELSAVFKNRLKEAEGDEEKGTAAFLMLVALKLQAMMYDSLIGASEAVVKKTVEEVAEAVFKQIDFNFGEPKNEKSRNASDLSLKN